jgi:sulfatase maturation enzyme AslB (radical SAM superfamily)
MNLCREGWSKNAWQIQKRELEIAERNPYEKIGISIDGKTRIATTERKWKWNKGKGCE